MIRRLFLQNKFYCLDVRPKQISHIQPMKHRSYPMHIHCSSTPQHIHTIQNPSNWRLSSSLTISTKSSSSISKAIDEIYSYKPEIAFFDVETTVPTRPGQGFALLEFGAILVCPKTLKELSSYSTLIQPHNPNLMTSLSVRRNGITRDAVASVPFFADVAGDVYDVLHERIWAGHNIERFDCVRIKEAFSEIGRSPPEPKGTIDTLARLTRRFGRRAGNMKLASLAAYLGVGKQTHRSLDDARMNLEVLKRCATVLFLEDEIKNGERIKTLESSVARLNEEFVAVKKEEDSAEKLACAEKLTRDENIRDLTRHYDDLKLFAEMINRSLRDLEECKVDERDLVEKIRTSLSTLNLYQ